MQLPEMLGAGRVNFETKSPNCSIGSIQHDDILIVYFCGSGLICYCKGVITDFFDGICTVLPELVNLIYYGGLLHEFHIFLKRLR